MTLSDAYTINGDSLYDTYGIWIESGTDNFITLPESKDRLTEDWADEDGLDFDTTETIKFKSRDITLNCAIKASDMTDFLTKWNSFIALIRTANTFSLFVKRYGITYNLLYKNSTDFKNYTNIPRNDGILAKFQLIVTEPNPATILTADTTTVLRVISTEGQNPINTEGGANIGG
jgi:hypothetical protein